MNRRRLAPLLVVPFLLVLAGCSQVQDAALEIAGDAASQVGAAAADELREQICSPLQDGQLSEQDEQILSGLLSLASAAGVPSEFVSPVEDIAQAGDQLPADAVTALQDACGITATPTPTPGSAR